MHCKFVIGHNVSNRGIAAYHHRQTKVFLSGIFCFFFANGGLNQANLFQYRSAPQFWRGDSATYTMLSKKYLLRCNTCVTRIVSNCILTMFPWHACTVLLDQNTVLTLRLDPMTWRLGKPKAVNLLTTYLLVCDCAVSLACSPSDCILSACCAQTELRQPHFL